MKLRKLLPVVLLASLILGACSKYNKVEVQDRNANSERIYGDKGGPAKQMANKYESDPKTAEQVKAIKEKLYPSQK